MYRQALAPSRSTNSFTIGFGLLNIPVSVLTSLEETAVKRAEFITVDGALHPVGRMSYDKVTGGPVDTGDVLRYAFDTASGQQVPLSDDEMSACTMPKGVAEIVCFVPLAQLHKQYLTVGLAQVRAKTSGMKAAQKSMAQRTYGLLLAGLAERKVAALLKVALQGPAKFAALTPDGDLLWLQASDGIRQAAEMDAQSYSEAELAMVGTLIDTIGKQSPAITDDTAMKITAFVAAKAKGMTSVSTEALAEPAITDMFAILSASIDAVKGGK